MRRGLSQTNGRDGQSQLLLIELLSKHHAGSPAPKEPEPRRPVSQFELIDFMVAKHK